MIREIDSQLAEVETFCRKVKEASVQVAWALDISDPLSPSCTSLFPLYQLSVTTPLSQYPTFYLLVGKVPQISSIYVAQRARGAYIATVSQPQAAFALSYAAQIIEPIYEDAQYLNRCLSWQLEGRSLTFV